MAHLSRSKGMGMTSAAIPSIQQVWVSICCHKGFSCSASSVQFPLPSWREGAAEQTKPTHHFFLKF